MVMGDMSYQGKDISPGDLLKHVGSLSQVAGLQRLRCAEGPEKGCEFIRLKNGSGLEADILTDRGMSLGNVSFCGIPLAFLTPAGYTHPAYTENGGLEWLKTFPGGLLTTCGLTQVGLPGQDGPETLGLHGRAANLSASELRTETRRDGKGFVFEASGLVREWMFFFHNVTLRRIVSARFGEPSLTITDEFRNEGFKRAPFMILQHMNFGFPMLGPKSRLVLPKGRTIPRNDDARLGLGKELVFQPPTRGYREQVFYHDLEAGAGGRVAVELRNPDIGGRPMAVRIEYLKKDYPVLVEWKMMGQGDYVLGIEPGNCMVGGRLEAREKKHLKYLAPGEKKTLTLKLSFLRG